jgi:hypothetical protein
MGEREEAEGLRAEMAAELVRLGARIVVCGHGPLPRDADLLARAEATEAALAQARDEADRLRPIADAAAALCAAEREMDRRYNGDAPDDVDEGDWQAEADIAWQEAFTALMALVPATPAPERTGGAG